MTRLGVGAAVGLPVKDGLGRGDKLTRAVWVYDDEALAYEVSLCIIVDVVCADDDTLTEAEEEGYALADAEEEAYALADAEEERYALVDAEEEGYALADAEEEGYAVADAEEEGLSDA